MNIIVRRWYDGKIIEVLPEGMNYDQDILDSANISSQRIEITSKHTVIESIFLISWQQYRRDHQALTGATCTMNSQILNPNSKDIKP
jgi:hypothetical protein